MNKISKSYRVFIIFNTIFMILILLVCIIPYLHTLAKALNDGYDTMLGGLTIYPRKLTFQNFKVLLSDASMYSALLVSVARVVIGTVLGILMQFSAAYVLSKERFYGKRAVMLFLIIPTFFSGGTIPTYILYSTFGLTNNFWVYILPGLVTYYNILIIKSYISSSVPYSLREAAMLDGAGEVRIMLQVVFPLCKPVIATIALWIAVGQWNNYTDTLYYITKEHLYTLSYKLMQIVQESERLKALIQEAALMGENIASEVKSTPESLVAAQVIVTTIPIIVVYPFLQKYFVKGVTLGAVKS